MKVSVVLLAHDEETNIGRMIDGLLQRYPETIFELIVVDDASHDATAQVVQEKMRQYPSVKLVSKGPPCGVGRAMKVGLSRVDPATDYVLTMDSDFLENIPQVELLFAQAQAGQKAVMGSRFLKASALRGYRPEKWLVNRFYHFMIWACFGLRQHDVTNNFKLCKYDIIRSIPLRSSGFAVNAELGILPYVYGVTMAEVPVSWTERSSGMGKSKFKIISVWFDYAVSLFWCLWIKYRGVRARNG